MATFSQVLAEFQDMQIQRQRETAPDIVRRGHVKALHELTGRNVICYYSSWLTRGADAAMTTMINDEDKHGFMAVFAGLDFDKGLDLVLHTPGGEVAAAESIIEYIRSKFADNVRIIVPQISMSGGTLISLAGREIIMGRHSNLGPIDPQFGNMPAQAILAEFERARGDIAGDPNLAALWVPILQKYPPTLLSRAQQAIEWTREIAEKALREGAMIDGADKDAKAKEIVEFLLSGDLHKAHGRHIHRDELARRGMRIVNLEDDKGLQDAVLTVHHAFMLTMSNFGALKLIENHAGISHIKAQAMIQVPQMAQSPMAPPAQPVPPPGPGPVPAPVQPQQVNVPPMTWGQKWQIIRQILKAKSP